MMETRRRVSLSRASSSSAATTGTASGVASGNGNNGRNDRADGSLHPADQVKRKRGRPRKFPEDPPLSKRGSSSLSLPSTSASSPVPSSSPSVEKSLGQLAVSETDDLSASPAPSSIPIAPECPVCHKNIPGDEADASLHVEECLREQHQQQHGRPHPSRSGRGMEGRAGGGGLETTVLPPPIPSDPGQRTAVRPALPLEETNVDVLAADEDAIYGPPQYTEQDVAAALSSIVDSFNTPDQASPPPHPHFSPNDRKVVCVYRRDTMEALIQTVHLQDQIIQRIPRCVICLEPHRKPVVSTVCWHVFCESCWLRTIASKRVCPHCSSITSPSDLRRVYL